MGFGEGLFECQDCKQSLGVPSLISLLMYVICIVTKYAAVK